MNWFKAVKIGLALAGEIMDAAQDGQISYTELVRIARRAARAAGLVIRFNKWTPPRMKK